MGSPTSFFKDVAIALAFVGTLLGALWLYAGVWPPVVVVESGSMMHDEASFGRFGTIDPGDLVVVKRVDAGDAGWDVSVWAARETESYGDYGDVIVFYLGSDHQGVPIIHRAMSWVDVERTRAGFQYTLLWPPDLDCGSGTRAEAHCVYDSRGIYLPALGFDESTADRSTGRTFSREAGYKPLRSGFITQGDNPLTNAAADQATGLAPGPVQPDWLAGKARGELPWFGLLKLAVAKDINQQNPPSSWVRIGNAYAPPDLWAMLAISVAALIAVPVGLDAVRDWRAAKKEGGKNAAKASSSAGSLRERERPGIDGDPAPAAPARARFEPVAREAPRPGDPPRAPPSTRPTSPPATPRKESWEPLDE